MGSPKFGDKPFGKVTRQKRHPGAREPYLIKRADWSWFSVELAKIQPTELEFSLRGNTAYLGLFDFVRSDGETTVDGGNRSTLKDLRNALAFVPAGSSVEGWARYKFRTSSIIGVHLGALEIGPDISNVDPSLYFRNEYLRTTLLKLRDALDGSGIDDAAYAETLALSLLWEIRHAAYGPMSQQSSIRGGLTARQLKLVTEFIDSKIAAAITISELAALVGLSQFHFIRAFKASLGKSPYQYVLSERIRRATELLPDLTLSLSDVARAVGFSDAIQLNRAFQKLVGTTPTAFRRDAGSDSS